jgi:hypothetical protein
VGVVLRVIVGLAMVAGLAFGYRSGWFGMRLDHALSLLSP